MFQVKINETVFTIENQNSILQTVIDKGFSVSHSCRSGRCNECIVTLENKGIVEEVLSCQYIPKFGDNFTFERFEQIRLPKRQVYPAKIKELSRLSDRYMLVKLKLPAGKNLDFLPGQYINVIKNGLGHRSYSVASCKGSEYISLIIQMVEGGQFSKFWFVSAKKGDLVQIQGPFGSFYMRQNSSTNEVKTIFAATGSGIAPLTSMLSSYPNLINDNFYAFWSMQYFDNFFKKNIFENNVDNKIWQRYLTKENKSGFGSGRIVNPIISLIEEMLSEGSKKIDVYACGNNAFVNSLKDKIQKVGSKNISFYSDPFFESGI
jgi:CDP-4-dehydro-6-deoxyglucose reductase, E3